MARFQRLKEKNPVGVDKQKSIFSEGLVLAGITAAIYILTFAFEYGYCAHFGVPGFIVEPSTGTILFAGLIVVMASVTLYNVGHLPIALLRKIPWTRLRSRLIVICVMWIFAFLMGSVYQWQSLIMLILVTIILSIDYVLSLMFLQGSFVERISKAELSVNNSDYFSLAVKNAVGKRIILYIMAIYIALIVSFSSGLVHARLQQGFVVIKSSPDIAVIKRYGDRIIAIRYEGNPARATGEFKVIDKEKDMDFINMSDLKIESFRK